MNNINIRLFQWRISFLLWRLNVRCAWKRLLYCSRDYHRLTSGATTVKNSEGLWLRTAFVKCVFCNTLFFPNKNYKRSYQRIRQRERADFSGYLNTAHFLENTNMSKKERSKLMSGKLKTKEFEVKSK